MLQQLHTAWLRASANFTNTHQALEEELQRIRQKPNVPQEVIERKDAQIEQLVTFYNQTEELMQAYRHALAQARTENHFLTEMLARKMTVGELLQYKPSTRTIIDQVNKTGIAQVLTEIPKS